MTSTYASCLCFAVKASTMRVLACEGAVGAAGAASHLGAHRAQQALQPGRGGLQMDKCSVEFRVQGQVLCLQCGWEGKGCPTAL